LNNLNIVRKRCFADESIIVVSGIPRSGTSMVMKMLDAGGLDVVTDNIRKADNDNPMGYYEYEKVKSLEKDNTWLDEMKGRGIKIISHLLYSLSLHLSYKIIFMERDMQEILASQRKMYERLQKAPGNIKDSVLATKFNLHLRKIYGWIGQKSNIDCLHVNYRDIINQPLDQAQTMQTFLGVPLDVEKMASAVEPGLYRNRKV